MADGGAGQFLSFGAGARASAGQIFNFGAGASARAMFVVPVPVPAY